MLNDNDRIAYFNRKKKSIIDRMLGPETPYPIPDPVSIRYTSDSKNGSWYGKPRILKNMNLDRQSQEYLAWFNEEFRKSNGRIVKHVEGGLDAAVPDPIK